jgi:hypothetical protein
MMAYIARNKLWTNKKHLIVWRQIIPIFDVILIWSKWFNTETARQLLTEVSRVEFLQEKLSNGLRADNYMTERRTD